MSESQPSPEYLSQFSVTCHISEELRALDGEPVSDELSEIFETCRFDLGEHAYRAGQKFTRDDLRESQELFDEFNISERLSRIVARVQAIQPDIRLAPVPLHFVYTGRNPGGKSLRGTAIVVNLGNPLYEMRDGECDPDGALRWIEDIAVHEGVHCLVTQMHDRRTWNSLGGLWDDGLAVFVGPESWTRNMGLEEFTYWLSALRRWIDLNDKEAKVAFVRKYLDVSANPYLTPQVRDKLLEMADVGEDPEVVFTEMLFMTGKRYAIGRELWKRRLSRGESVPALVKKGPADIVRWIKEEAER